MLQNIKVRMSFKKLPHQQIHKILIALAIILFAGSAIYGLATGQDYFSDNNLRSLALSVRSYGYLAPLIIFAGIFLPQAIPFFPIPTQFFEIAAGLIYGLWPGLILAWVSQMVTAIISYYMSEKVDHLLAEKMEKSPVIKFFHHFIARHQALAIFTIRTTMTAPVNVSYLAGILDMNIGTFLLATCFGVITEVVIFVYLGTLISAQVHFSLWLIFVLVVSLSLLPTLIVLSAKTINSKRTSVK